MIAAKTPAPIPMPALDCMPAATLPEGRGDTEAVVVEALPEPEPELDDPEDPEDSEPLLPEPEPEPELEVPVEAGTTVVMVLG